MPLSKGGLSQEYFAPLIKYLHLVPSVLTKVFSDLFYRFFFSQLRFRVKLIRKADDLFLQAYRSHISVRDGQLTVNDCLQTKPRTGMPFTHPSVFWKSFQCEQFPSQITVANIGKRAFTGNMGRIGLKNAYVVKHTGLLNKADIDCQFRMISVTLVTCER